jgi:hypothetical protein
MVMLVARLFKVEALESDVAYVSGTVIAGANVSGTVIAGANVSGIVASADPNEFKQGAPPVARAVAAFCMLPPPPPTLLMPAAHLFYACAAPAACFLWHLWGHACTACCTRV